MPYSEETASYKFNHTMLRIKDPNVSIPFYTDANYRNGFHRKRANHILRYISDSPNDWFIAHTKPRIELEFSDFTLYFLAFDHSGGKATEAEKKANRHKREGILELTHNPGTETLDKTPYHSGNSEPRGFGHIAITVDDVEAACARFERLGVPFKKRLTDGKIKSIAFILDPDGYWIEVLPSRPLF